MEEKINTIRQKCIEANPEIVNQTCTHKLMADESGCPSGKHERAIRLSDILHTLFYHEVWKSHGVPAILESGMFGILTDDSVFKSSDVMWLLAKDDLTLQREETIDFIHTLLLTNTL